MKNLILVLIFSISVVGCSTTQKSTNELEKRAKHPAEETEVPKYVPKVKRQRVETVCVSGRFLKNGAWMHQTWVSLMIEEPDMVFTDPMIKKIQGRK